MSDPVFALVLVAHVLAGLIGFGALTATGTYAAAVRRSPDPFAARSLVRFFRPGHNLAARVIFVVPVLGGVLVGLSGDASRAYPWIGLLLWVLACAVASGVIWPAESKIQGLIAVAEGDRRELATACRRCELAAAVTTACFLAAFVVMIAQP